jgi:hypothetical protein
LSRSQLLFRFIGLRLRKRQPTRALPGGHRLDDESMAAVGGQRRFGPLQCGGGHIAPSMASQPSSAIHGRAFGRFDEILDLVEKTSVLTRCREATPWDREGLRPARSKGLGP